MMEAYMKILRNKFLIGLICIILGLVVGFVAIPQVQYRDKADLVKAIRLKQIGRASCRERV